MVSPAQTFDGRDLYPEVADKAAIVTFNIAKAYHPFVDGNKRAAAIAMLATCYLNSFVPVLTQAELVAVILLVVQGEMDREGLAEFLRKRMT
jgi:death-on-curing protein